MTLAAGIRSRPARVAGAFLVVLSALVFISDGNSADAASDDISVLISVDTGSIVHGGVSSWTVSVETTAGATTATGIVVTDTIPDGLCLQGVGDADCPGGVAPSPAPASATENSDGSWTVVWNLPDMGTSEQVLITYSTLTRTYYQEAFADDTPILSRDSWTNWAHLDAVVDSQSAGKDSTAAQSAASATVAKDVATRPAALVQPAVCGDGSALSWNAVNTTGYRMGDQVCWRVTVDYPAGLYTAGSTVQDNLPSGQTFTAQDTWAPGSGNTVPVGQIDGSAITAGDTALVWSVGDASGYVADGLVLELVFSSTVADPTATWSGQIVTSSMNHANTNTPGSVFNAGDSAGVGVDEAELALIKGVSAINGFPTGGSVDGATVKEADAVTYQVTVSNGGDIDANDIEVWDLLPTEYATCSTNVGSISDGGACSDANNRVEWTGAAVFSVPAGSNVTRTYVVTFPTGISPGETLNNLAGVRTYTSATNNGSGSFTYVPTSNIDSGVGTTNTAAADDASSVVTANPTIGITRVTSIDEAGNASYQATIGEQVTYTITLVIPEGTTVYEAVLTDDLPANLDLISSSPTFDGEQPVSIAEDPATDTVTVTFPSPSYTNAAGTGDDTLTVTIVGQVIDVPINTRGTSISNTATFTWLSHESVTRETAAVVTTTVVEPLMGIAKSSVDSIGNDGTVIGDEVVDYTVAISNSGAANVSTAHDLVVVDTLPEGVTVTLPVPDSGVWVADGTPGDGIGGTITWTISSLAPGTSVNRTYQVTVDNPVTVSTSFSNKVTVDATSRAGTPTVERTTGTGYYAEDQHTLTTPLASISKGVSPTKATVGDVLTYSIDVTIPPGTIMYDATVIDTPPTGVGYDGIISSTCDMGGAACDPDIVATEIGSGSEPSFFLGDIDVPSVTGEDRVVTITYAAHLTDVGSAGATRVNSASVYGNRTDLIVGTPGTTPSPASFEVVVGPTIATVTLAEPSLTIDKDVVGQVSDTDSRRAVPGEVLTYNISVANSGSVNASSAYDITIVDVVPEDVTLSLPVADSGVWVPDAVAGDGIGGTITWTYAGPLAPGASLTRSYDVTIDASLSSSYEDPVGAELQGAADVPSYYGVSEADRLANPTFAYRNYDNVTADNVVVELDLASIGDYVWFDINGDGFQDVGEPPLAGIDITVTYLGPDGVASGDDEVHIATTDASGAYLVEHLPGGQYTVVVDIADLPPGLAPSYDLDDGTLSPDNMWGPGPLGEDEDKLGVDFGYTGTGSIGDTVWFDIDADGVLDGDEYGLEGVVVTVTWAGFDGIPSGDDIAYNLVTDSSGAYSVGFLPAGNYTVDVDALTLPAGMHATYDADGVATANSSALGLGAAEDNLAQDFGYAGAGAIGNWVWLDSDGDGNQDSGEFGLAGVSVELIWPGEDGVLAGGDDEPFLTTTDIDGFYLFDNLPPGEYQVTVLGGLPLAATNTYDADGGGDSTAVENLADAENQVAIDFGFQGTASVGDVVWWDMDADGSVDAGEPGIEGVELILTYAGEDGAFGTLDDLPLVTFSDSAGSYAFTDLPAGTYRVAVNSGVPPGMLPTYDEDGGLDETSLVGAIVVGEFHLGADFGYNGTGSSGDFVWLDLNADGVQDPLEPGIPWVDLTLSWYGVDGAEGTADDVTLTTTSDIDGNYLFVDLPAGGYTTAVDAGSLPFGMSATYDFDGLVSVDSARFVLGAAESRGDQDFGYNGGASIGDTVWFDRNDDGVVDPDEYGISGVDVSVIWAGPDLVLGTADDETFPATTDGDGHYMISQLPPGEYAILVDAGTLPVGMIPVYDEDGTPDNQTIVVLEVGGVHHVADFGYRGTGEIGDLVWLDIDGDGTPLSPEPGVPGQNVQLTDAGIDDVLGTGDDQVYLTTSAPDGEYLFSNLPPGGYAVAVVGGIADAAANTADEDADLDSYVELVLGDGESHRTADFGYRGSAEVGDLVWHDLNGNAALDPGEPGVAGVEVAVIWSGSDGVSGGGDDLVLPTAVSDAAGAYLVDSLPAGNYVVAVSGSVPSGLVNSYDEDGNQDGYFELIGLAGGDSHLSTDFGYMGTGAVGDLLWWDLDGNGAADPGETGLAGVTLTLTWAGFDDVLATGDDAGFVQTTDSDGRYLFEHLAPGDYELVLDSADLPAGVYQSADPDGVADAMTLLTLGAFDINLEQDFGYRGEGSIGDLVWYDVDSDGEPDSNEPGVSDASIVVAYNGADGTATEPVLFEVTTAGDGSYAVPGLPSGFYDVTIDGSGLAEGLSVSSDSDGGDPQVTSLVLGAASVEVDVDFGVVGSASFVGMVWNDRNGDAGIDATEVGIAEIGVNTTWTEVDEVPGVAAATDVYGNWEIAQLPPGTYRVEIDATTVPVGMAMTTDPSQVVALDATGSALANFGVALLLDVGSGVWFDMDGDGVFDSSENGINEVLVYLYDSEGVLVAFTETDETGRYLFDDLLPGVYLVQLIPDSLPAGARPSWDRDGSPDLNTLIDLTSGADVLDAGFAFQVDVLPNTGIDIDRVSAWAAISILVGVALVGAVSRRRRLLG